MGRPDGKRLKNIGLEYTVASHIMARRSDSMNMTTLYIPIEPMRRYMNQKRKEGKKYSHLSIMIATIVRTISQFPSINRFVVNKRIYARSEIAIGMVVLKGGRIDEIGTTSKMKFQPENTIEDVNNTINAYVEKNRSADDVNGTDKIAGVLTSVPGLLRVGVNVLKFLDNHNWMPKSVIEASPFHCTMMLTNLASIRTNHIYHHAYDFGTCSLTLAMGNLVDRVVVKNGEPTVERCLPLGLVMDERICSGAYFAMAFREFQKYLENPALLEVPPKTIKTE